MVCSPLAFDIGRFVLSVLLVSDFAPIRYILFPYPALTSSAPVSRSKRAFDITSDLDIRTVSDVGALDLTRSWACDDLLEFRKGLRVRGTARDRRVRSEL